MSSSRCRTRAPDAARVNRSCRLARLGKKKAGVGLVSILSATALALPASALAIGTAPSLGTADPFAVLGASEVTNTGLTTVFGDLGVSPATSITGFPPGIVLGATHNSDAVALQAQSDTTTAYNVLAGEAPDPPLSPADIGNGQTLTPGVYKSGSTLEVTGSLTLNGQGDPNSVFIFQVPSSLTTDVGSTITFTNGAQSCNVFWQVGSSATLNGSTFVGNVLALASITVGNAVTVDGRLLARTAAVTLINDTITRADCMPGGTGGGGTGGGGTGGGGGGGGGGTGGTPPVTTPPGTGGTPPVTPPPGTGGTPPVTPPPGTGGTPPAGTPPVAPPAGTPPTGTPPVTPPAGTPPTGTPVTTPPVTTPGAGKPIGSRNTTNRKQRARRLAKQRAQRLAKQRAHRLAQQRARRLAQQRAHRRARQRAVRLARQRAHRSAARRPKGVPGFTG